MKKIFSVLLVLFALAFCVKTQAQTLQVGQSSNWEMFPVVATDKLDADGETITKTFDLSKKSKIQYYTIFVDMDTVLMPGTLGHDVPVYLQESYDASNFINIDTVSFYGSADTVFTFSDLSTGTAAPYLRLYFYGDDADSINVQLMKVSGKFFNK